MASKSFSINKDDFARWGWTVLAGVIATVLDIIALQVIPALAEAGGPANAAIVAVLTLVVDLVRRYMSDTTKVSPQESVNTTVVKTKTIGPISKIKSFFGFK